MQMQSVYTLEFYSSLDVSGLCKIILKIFLLKMEGVVVEEKKILLFETSCCLKSKSLQRTTYAFVNQNVRLSHKVTLLKVYVLLYKTDCVDQHVELSKYFESYITVFSSLSYITAKTVSLGCLYVMRRVKSRWTKTGFPMYL